MGFQLPNPPSSGGGGGGSGASILASATPPAWYADASFQGRAYTDSGTNVLCGDLDACGYVRCGGIGPNTVNLIGSMPVLYQAVAANRPTFRTNLINGLCALQFDGTNDFYEFWSRTNTNTGDVVTSGATAITPVISTNEAAFIFAGTVVAAGPVAPNPYDWDGVFGDTNGNFGLYVASLGGSNVRFSLELFSGVQYQVTADSQIATPIVVYARYFNRTLSLSINNGAPSTLTNVPAILGGSFAANLGRGYITSGRYSNINMTHFLVWQTAPSDIEVQSIVQTIGQQIGAAV